MCIIVIKENIELTERCGASCQGQSLYFQGQTSPCSTSPVYYTDTQPDEQSVMKPMNCWPKYPLKPSSIPCHYYCRDPG